MASCGWQLPESVRDDVVRNTGYGVELVTCAFPLPLIHVWLLPLKSNRTYAMEGAMLVSLQKVWYFVAV